LHTIKDAMRNEVWHRPDSVKRETADALENQINDQPYGDLAGFLSEAVRSDDASAIAAGIIAHPASLLMDDDAIEHLEVIKQRPGDLSSSGDRAFLEACLAMVQTVEEGVR
jgi:hypothetical protein